MANLPALGASSDAILVAGFSAGSFMASQVAIAWPDVFRCSGLMSGGINYTSMARLNEDLKNLDGTPVLKENRGSVTKESIDKYYDKTVEWINKFEKE